MNISDKKWSIPMEVDEQAIDDLGLDRKDIVKMKIGCRTVNAIMVPCTETQYRNYMREVWNEEQRIFRSRKCMVPSGKTGKPVRCTKSCKDCGKMKSGTTLSLDVFEEEFDYEPEDLYKATTNECDTALTLMLMNELIAKLQAQSPELATVFTMLLDGETHRTIAVAIHKSRQTTTDIISRLRKQLQEDVSRSDLLG